METNGTSPFSKIVRVNNVGGFPVSLLPANRATSVPLVIAPHSREFVRIPPKSNQWETRVRIMGEIPTSKEDNSSRRRCGPGSLLTELRRLLLIKDVSRLQLQFTSHRPEIVRVLYSALMKIPNLTVAYGRQIVTETSHHDALPPKKRLRLHRAATDSITPPSSTENTTLQRKEILGVHQIYVSAQSSADLLAAGRVCAFIVDTSPHRVIVNIATLSSSSINESS